jgi:hypothetical protein
MLYSDMHIYTHTRKVYILHCVIYLNNESTYIDISFLYPRAKAFGVFCSVVRKSISMFSVPLERMNSYEFSENHGNNVSGARTEHTSGGTELYSAETERNSAAEFRSKCPGIRCFRFGVLVLPCPGIPPKLAIGLATIH